MEIEPRRERVERLVRDMVRLRTLGHEAVQSAAYDVVAQEYLQAQVDQRYPDDPPGTYSHYTTG